jgi:hypothetical protein
VPITQLPGGSYSQTCQACTVTDSVLQCDCRNENGAEVFASLNLNTCVSGSTVANTNGALTCQLLNPTPTPNPVKPPKGGTGGCGGTRACREP